MLNSTEIVKAVTFAPSGGSAGSTFTTTPVGPFVVAVRKA